MTFYTDDMMKNIHAIVGNIVIKYESEGIKHETLESRVAADIYISAMNGVDGFHSYKSFSVEALKLAGCNEFEISEWYFDKNKIPSERRDSIVTQERKITIRDYVELNPYYRTIAGLPALDDQEVIFAPPDYYNDLGLLPCPVYQLPDVYLVALEKSGFLDEAREKYPSKKYLNYLGASRVDLCLARKALNYSILRLDASLVNSKIYETFIMAYESAREYYMRVIYNKDMNLNYAYYPNLIGLCIMVTALNKVIQYNIQNVIERDLFDLNTIRLLYEAYNIPFVNKLPIEYHRLLVRNINYLLSNKSTDKVLIDILELFGYSHIQMFKYYLVKEHNLDYDKKPIFAYTTDENGRTVPDYEKMYSFHFQTVNVNERNVAHAIVETHQVEKYNYVIADDPYWIDDKSLKDVLYTREFNYVETKYIGINLMYLMTNKLFDLQYGIRMVVDSKIELEKFLIRVPRVFGIQSFKLFDVVMALMTMLCKRSKFKGNVLVTPGQISSVKGFNFKNDLKVIASEILENPLIDNSVAEKLLVMDFSTKEDVGIVYDNIVYLYEFVVENRYRASSIEVYKAYDNIFNTLLITKENTESFTIDGVFTETYEECLRQSNMVLYAYVTGLKEQEITSAMDSLIAAIIEIIPNFTNLRLINNSDNVIVEAIIKLVSYFKSYTTDIINLSAYYFLNDKADNILKLLGSFNITHWDDMSTKQYLNLMYDHIGGMAELYVKDLLHSKDEIENLGDSIGGWKEIIHNEHIKIMDFLVENVRVDYMQTEVLEIQNMINNMEKHIGLDDILKMSLSELMNLQAHMEHLENFSIADKMPDYMSDIHVSSTIDEYEHFIEDLEVDYHTGDLKKLIFSDSIMEMIKSMELKDSFTDSHVVDNETTGSGLRSTIMSAYDFINPDADCSMLDTAKTIDKITLIRE